MVYDEFVEELPRLKQRAVEILREHNNKKSFDNFYNCMKENTAYMKYCRGGEELHRGILCPNFFQDWITGGMRRGRYVKSLRTGHNAFKYHFDNSDSLICVEVNSSIPDIFEFQFYEGNICWGIQYGTELVAGKQWIAYIYCTMINAGRVEMDLLFMCTRTDQNKIIKTSAWLFDYRNNVPISITKRIDGFDVNLPGGVRYTFSQEDYTLYTNAEGEVESYSYISYCDFLTREYPPFSPPKPLKKDSWQNVYGMVKCCSST